MLFSGETLICLRSFFVFNEGEKYYCTHVIDGHFFIYNKTGIYGVNTIKIPLSMKNYFKIRTNGVYNESR